MEPETATRARPPRPILITLCCLVGFAGLLVIAYSLIRNWEAILASNGWSFILAPIIFGSIGLAAFIGYWQMRRWGLYLYATMTALNLFYQVASGSPSLNDVLSGAAADPRYALLSQIVVIAIGCAYFTRME